MEGPKVVSLLHLKINEQRILRQLRINWRDLCATGGSHHFINAGVGTRYGAGFEENSELNKCKFSWTLGPMSV
jgi:hypothetical protein